MCVYLYISAIHPVLKSIIFYVKGAPRRKRPSAEAATLAEVINELVKTERSYVRKLHILKRSYAVPLRSFARDKDTAIIPQYEANTMFGNLDNIISANEAFLSDLESMLSRSGMKDASGIGDVLLRHVGPLCSSSEIHSMATLRLVQGNQDIRLLQTVLFQDRGSSVYF